jgi:hypothetical protein
VVGDGDGLALGEGVGVTVGDGLGEAVALGLGDGFTGRLACASGAPSAMIERAVTRSAAD